MTAVRDEWDRLWKVADDLYERACVEDRELTRSERRAIAHAEVKARQLDIIGAFDAEVRASTPTADKGRHDRA